MLTQKNHSVFLDIPRGLDTELENEVLSLYFSAARDHIVPCIEELTKKLGYFNTLLAFHEVTGKSRVSDATEFSHFIEHHINSESYIGTFFRIHSNVEYYFKTNGYFFERNWLFAVMPMHYESCFINSPLVNVW